MKKWCHVFTHSSRDKGPIGKVMTFYRQAILGQVCSLDAPVSFHSP